MIPFNYLLHYSYLFRYREIRKQTKILVDIDNYVEAKTKLDTAIQEHISFYPDADQRRDFNYGEKIMMNHALAHLNAVIDKGDPTFINNDGSTGHHSDIVKEGLLHIPKSDYSDND